MPQVEPTKRTSAKSAPEATKRASAKSGHSLPLRGRVGEGARVGEGGRPRPAGDATADPRLFKAVTGDRPATDIIGQIRGLLSRGQLRTGDRLPSERELAERFAVSRNTVRQ